jgi:hypothetical protein
VVSSQRRSGAHAKSWCFVAKDETRVRSSKSRFALKTAVEQRHKPYHCKILNAIDDSEINFPPTLMQAIDIEQDQSDLVGLLVIWTGYCAVLRIREAVIGFLLPT